MQIFELLKDPAELWSKGELIPTTFCRAYERAKAPVHCDSNKGWSHEATDIQSALQRHYRNYSRDDLREELEGAMEDLQELISETIESVRGLERNLESRTQVSSL